MARMIDADAMLAELKPITYEMEHTSVLISDMSNIMRNWVERQPTLPQPNEPLTLKELTLMIEPTPVWWDWVQGWVLARKGMIISWNGVYYDFEEVKGNFYRRPPEEPLMCEGCVHEINEHENCNYCIRAGSLSDYYCRRTPDGEEEA